MEGLPSLRIISLIKANVASKKININLKEKDVGNEDGASEKILDVERPI